MPEPSADFLAFLHLLNLLWIGAGTLFWKLWGRIDRVELALNDKATQADMDKRHAEYIGRLDKLIGTMERIDEKVDKMRETAAVLADRAGLRSDRD